MLPNEPRLSAASGPPEGGASWIHRKSIRLLIGLLLLSFGAAALARPWLASSPRWDWPIRTDGDLTGAEVIADIIQQDHGGLYLQARGNRAISLISPPMQGIASGRPCVEVLISQINDAQAQGSTPKRVTVNLFWQTAPGDPFRMETSSTALPADGSAARILFTPPLDAAALHRMGVQVRDLVQVQIHSLRMIDADMRLRAGSLWRELSEPELFAGESVNFYKGPNLLGRGLNYYLVALCGVTLGILVLRSGKARRPLTVQAMVIAILIPWVIGDVLFSTQLTRRAFAESSTLRELSPDEAIRAVYGDDLGIAAEWLRILPIGSRVCVLAREGTTASHRLAYLAAPHMIAIDRPQDAEYIVLLDGDASLQGEQTLMLADSRENLAVRIIARWAGGALLERVPG